MDLEVSELWFVCDFDFVLLKISLQTIRIFSEFYILYQVIERIFKFFKFANSRSSSDTSKSIGFLLGLLGRVEEEEASPSEISNEYFNTMNELLYSPCTQ